MRVYISYSSTAGFVFMLDQERVLPADLIKNSFSPGVVTEVPQDKKPLHLPFSPAPLAKKVEDYPRNGKGEKCAICGREVKRGQGYKRISQTGFLCASCQYDDDLPLRPEDIVAPYDANAIFEVSMESQKS